MWEASTITFFLCLAGLAILIFGLSRASAWMEQRGADRLSSSRSMTRFRTWSLLNTNFFLAIFSGLLVLVTSLQYRANIISERAFLFVDGLRFHTGEPTADGPFPLIMTLKNSGRTVAILKELRISLQLGIHQKDALPDEPNYTTNMVGVNTVLPIIPPGVDHTFPIRGILLQKNKSFNTQVVSDLISGEDSFYVFGVLKYDNGYNYFGLSQLGFCFTYLPPSQRVGDTGENFVLCNKPKYVYFATSPS